LTIASSLSDNAIIDAVDALRAGGVIAYPTEYCFGLGCDPSNTDALKRLLKIKRRDHQQGVILIAANTRQVRMYVDLDTSPLASKIEASWPGPNTWILPALEQVSEWVRGQHSGVAMRVPAHRVCQEICTNFEGAIVSTSANRHGQPALQNASDVQAEMGVELDYILDAPVGGAERASVIRDGHSGRQLR